MLAKRYNGGVSVLLKNSRQVHGRDLCTQQLTFGFDAYPACPNQHTQQKMPVYSTPIKNGKHKKSVKVEREGQQYVVPIVGLGDGPQESSTDADPSADAHTDADGDGDRTPTMRGPYDPEAEEPNAHGAGVLCAVCALIHHPSLPPPPPPPPPPLCLSVCLLLPTRVISLYSRMFILTSAGATLAQDSATSQDATDGMELIQTTNGTSKWITKSTKAAGSLRNRVWSETVRVRAFVFSGYQRSPKSQVWHTFTHAHAHTHTHTHSKSHPHSMRNPVRSRGFAPYDVYGKKILKMC